MKRLVSQVRRIAPTLYGNLGYHGSRHPLEVEERAMKLVEMVERQGQKVDQEAVQVMCLMHDVAFGIRAKDFYLSNVGRPASCKEEVAAYLTEQVLRDLKAPQPFRDLVRVGIMGTNPSYPLESVEAKILAAADLYGVGNYPYQQMAADTHRLHQEMQALAGHKSYFKDFTYGSIGYLGKFTAREIHLTDGYYNDSGQSVWHRQAIANICALARQTFSVSGIRVVADYSLTGQPVVCANPRPVLGAETLYLLMQGESQLRLQAMERFAAYYQQTGGKPPMLVGMPHDPGAISLPDNTLDDLYLSVWDLPTFILAEYPNRELWRVLRPGGRLHFSAGQTLDRASVLQQQKLVRFFLITCPLLEDFNAEQLFGWEAVFEKI